MRIAAISLFGAIALSAASSSFAATLQVPAGYASIAAAVAAASSNDTIAVRSNYAGEATGLSFNNKNLAFISVDTDYSTPLVGAKIDQYVSIDASFVGTGTSDVSFWGFSISNIGGAGVEIFGNGTLTLTNCTLNSNVWNSVCALGNGTTVNLDNTAVNDNQHEGIATKYGFANPKVINVTNGSTVNHNYTGGGGNAPSIHLDAPTVLTVTNSQVNNTVGSGIFVDTNGAGATITLNGAHANGNSVGIQANYACSINVLNGSTVSNNAWQGIARSYNGGTLSSILVDNSTIANQVNGNGIILTDACGPVNVTVQNNSSVSTNTAANGIMVGAPDAAVTLNSSHADGNAVGVQANFQCSIGVVNGSTIRNNAWQGISRAYNGGTLSTILVDSSTISNQVNGRGIILSNGSGPVNLTIQNQSDVSTNSAENIYTEVPGSVVISQSSVTGCTGANTDGVLFTGGAALSVSMTSSTIAGNKRFGIYNYDCPISPFTITASSISGNGNNGFYNGGTLGSMAITGTTFAGNADTGMFLAASASGGSFTDCTFSSNANNGLVIDWNSAPFTVSLTGCTIKGHTFNGLVLNNNNGQVITMPVTGCTFSGNGADMYVAGTTSSRHNVTISKSVFRDGSSNAGTVVSLSAVNNTAITNCLVDHGLVGVSINDDNGSPKVYQNTFVGSTGTALSLASAACDVKNNIFAGFPTGISGTCTSDYNLYGTGVAVPGTEGGNSVTNKNPGFVTASTGVGTGDFHLTTASWAIVRGANTLGVAMDLEGTARPLPVTSPKPDMGAYEETTNANEAPVALSGFSAD